MENPIHSAPNNYFGPCSYEVLDEGELREIQIKQDVTNCLNILKADIDSFPKMYTTYGLYPKINLKQRSASEKSQNLVI